MKQFIELGWHTVPLSGKLERLEDGSKTIPRFEKDWKVHYKETFNKKVTVIGGVITGEVSNIIAIDCDNEITFNLFKQLDPNYEAIFYSKGKNKGITGTIIYRYEDGVDTFSSTDSDMALDIYSNDGFVYLPTIGNKTKLVWTSIAPINNMPRSTKLILQQLQKKVVVINEQEYTYSSQTRPCLAPLLSQFVGKRGDFIPSLFKIITPRDFRKEEQYQKLGYLHPKYIVKGNRSNYLSRVSAILGADESVDHTLYIDCMTNINNLLDDPMENDRMDATICGPMVESKSSVDNVPIWQYNEHWTEKRMTVITKHGLVVDLCFDPARNMYYFLDMTNENIKGFIKDTEFVSYLEVTVTTKLPKKPIMKQKLPLVNMISDPSQVFGFCKSNQPQVLAFNSFKPSAELSILHNPNDYKRFYKRPETILKYLECLVPNIEARNYLLEFIKRKLTYFEYSPVILFFLGVPGSGKDTFVNILQVIMNRVARPTTNEFLEKYNTWLLDTYFVQLDEYGDQLTKMADKEMAKGLLKAYTGKPDVEIRDMRTKGMPYKHNVTFLMTANKNPLMVDDQDRRIHLMDTPNVLELQPWFNADTYDQMWREIQDFCYYLAIEVRKLPKDEYMSPPKSADKHRLIADSMYAAQKIAYALEHNMRDYLIELALDHNAPLFAAGVKKGEFTSDDLETLYDELTDFKGDVKTIRKILRKKGFVAVPSTKMGAKIYKYHLDNVNPFGDD